MVRLTRRQLVGLAAAGSFSSRLAEPTENAETKPPLVVQSFIWTQQLRAQNKALGDALDEIFATARNAGFRHMELMPAFLEPDVTQRTLGLLKKHSLRAPIVYFGGPMHEPAAAEKTIARAVELGEVAKEAGARAINCNPLPKAGRGRKSDDELTTQAEALNRLGEQLRSRGLRLFVHHHDVEMAEDAREWRHVLNHTDPSLVSLCVDVEWAVHAGQNPLKLLEEAGARVASLHLRNSVGNVWTETLGEGDINYRQVAARLNRARLKPYLVVELAYARETKVTRSLLENLRLSRIYAEKVFGL